MKREWLGDILDHVKGSVIKACEDGNAKDVHVLPMITDRSPSAQDDPAWNCYAWVMGRDARRNPKVFLNRDRPFAFIRAEVSNADWLALRQDYIRRANASFTGDLFLDPDTGIASPDVEKAFLKGRPKNTVRRTRHGNRETNDHAYIHRAELASLTEGTDRFLIVYQHKHQGNADYLAATLERVGQIRLSGGQYLSCFGYSLTHASTIFICRSPARLEELRNHLEGKLKGAPNRIKTVDTQQKTGQI